MIEGVRGDCRFTRLLQGSNQGWKGNQTLPNPKPNESCH